MDVLTYNYQEQIEDIFVLLQVGRALPASFIRKFTRPFRIAWLMPRYLKLLSVLTSPAIRVLVRHDWKKVLIPLSGYLSPLLFRKNRIKAMTHHYNYLRLNLDKDFLTRIYQKPIALWMENTGGVSYQIVLSVSPSDYGQDREGDLSLSFMADSTCIFTLSFTICPGSVFNVDADHVMFVGRLQGGRNMMDLIRTSTKHCHDTSQHVLLLAVAQGICLSLNIRDMICSSSSGQHAVIRNDELCNVNSIYDEFWTAMGATKISDYAYHMPVPMPKKPLTLIERTHRRRAVKRREYRDAAADQAGATFCRLFMNQRRSLYVVRVPKRVPNRSQILTSCSNKHASLPSSPNQEAGSVKPPASTPPVMRGFPKGTSSGRADSRGGSRQLSGQPDGES